MIVILTGTGGEFIPGIDFPSFGNVADPGVWSQVHDEGVQILATNQMQHRFCLLPAKDICNVLLECSVKRDGHLRQIGEQDRIDDKTVFIIKKELKNGAAME